MWEGDGVFGVLPQKYDSSGHGRSGVWSEQSRAERAQGRINEVLGPRRYGSEWITDLEPPSDSKLRDMERKGTRSAMVGWVKKD